MMIVVALLLSATQVASPAVQIPQPVAPAAPAAQPEAPAAAAQPKAEKKICRREQGDSSSKLAGKKICLTAAEWKARQS